jgi:RNase H-fold protein (predicted Holliday junction resolvase)
MALKMMLSAEGFLTEPAVERFDAKMNHAMPTEIVLISERLSTFFAIYHL